jgi:hypothetical protein
MAQDIVARNPAPAYSAEGLAHLAQEIDALLGHLARAEPGALEACFMDSRGVAAAPPKVPPPRAMDTAPETLRGFIERVARITSEFSGRTAGRTMSGSELMAPDDYSFLLEVRSFLAQLVLPATVDTILVTQGYHDGLACLARAPGRLSRIAAAVAEMMPQLRRDRRGGPVLSPCQPAPAVAIAALEPIHVHQATESGWRFAGLARRLRQSAVVMVFVTLTFALYVFSGKTLQEEAQRLQTALGGIQQQIDTDFDRNAPRANAVAERLAGSSDRLGQLREAGFVFDPTLSYCNQPFLDDTGIIRYARPSQELNCNRLWGVNRAVNQNNRQMQAWIKPALWWPFNWLFGLFDVPVDLKRPALEIARVTSVAELQLRNTNRIGLLRVFPENARPISLNEAEALALRRACETSERTKSEVQSVRGRGSDPVTPAEADAAQPLADPAPSAPSATPTVISGQTRPCRRRSRRAPWAAAPASGRSCWASSWASAAASSTVPSRSS